MLCYVNIEISDIYIVVLLLVYLDKVKVVV